MIDTLCRYPLHLHLNSWFVDPRGERHERVDPSGTAAQGAHLRRQDAGQPDLRRVR